MSWYVAVPIAALAAFFIIRVGFRMLSGLGQPIAPPPEPGDMRKINLRYRCDICGAELKMLLATDDLPEPPRHCLDDMTLISPVE